MASSGSLQPGSQIRIPICQFLRSTERYLGASSAPGTAPRGRSLPLREAPRNGRMGVVLSIRHRVGNPAPHSTLFPPDRQTTTGKGRFGRRRLRVMGRANLHGCRRRWVRRAQSSGRWGAPLPRALSHHLFFLQASWRQGCPRWAS